MFRAPEGVHRASPGILQGGFPSLAKPAVPVGLRYPIAGFSSSATTQFKNFGDLEVNMFQFNKIINDAWLDEKFDVMSNFPRDIAEKEFIEIIESTKNKNFSVKEWQKWVAKFKNQFRASGCQID